MIRKIICELYLIAPHIKNEKRSHWGVSKKSVPKLINNVMGGSNTSLTAALKLQEFKSQPVFAISNL